MGRQGALGPQPAGRAPASTAAAGISPYVAEQLGWYVYLLRDPRDAEVFYVGKGRGNRVFAHQAHVAGSHSLALVAEEGAAGSSRTT